MENYYLIIKALHLVFVISWLAGLLYLPRLYVYHAEVTPGSDQDLLFQKMEKRLLRGIMNPAMVMTFILGGLLLMIIMGAGSEHKMPLWLHIKLSIVVLLTIFHMFLAKYRKDFVASKNRKSATFYRFINEIPAIAMIIIVLLAVLKPLQ